MKFLFLIFLVVPIIEIYFLIAVGSAIGAGLTIALIIFTALLGAFLVRAQGFSTFVRVQHQLSKGEMPAIEILEGLFLLVAGALLLTPGFFTDAIGFAFLTPPFRRWIIKRSLASGAWAGAVHGSSGHADYTETEVHLRGRVIEGEFHDVER